ncbi:MAG: DEAD/DEAH box helicase [Treponema succinifaciens]|uniref:DEAD/DEAH box helicase n=1 Tax=Treponema TaxID=157 RepID=UPI002357D8EC|nr:MULTISPECIES: DEAD/DEAH box helicase [Treponema]MDD6963184.1 DEAD/DEAH box helicase [Treponema succinifaciens]MDY2616140.1 DEAD/DEAH box helicase [Treponema succinifaciens]MDY5117946.1 DEAD/DEAH box helicase [Treponema succinifaciens]
MNKFLELKVDESIVSKLEEIGITEPTEVQKKIIPLISEGKNIMFQSETGTGKTFAYLLPLLSRLNSTENRMARLMIASPTYELASQIKVQVQKISGIKCALLIGGAPISRQIELLKEKPEIVIGGPARLLELIHLKKLKADGIETLVLDEADRLLSPELRDSTKGLMERLPKSVQLIGNSATVSKYTREILQKARNGILNDEKENAILFVALPMENVLRKQISHWAIFSERRDKIDTLRSFINAEKPKKLLVFTSKSDQIENIASKLRFKKIDCETLCGKTNKVDRKSAIDRFRSGKTKILITTDLASRGLDIEGITHVVQMDLPEKEDFFIHRAGRTARAGATGINCVIGDAWEMENYARLEKKLKITVFPKMLYKGNVVDPNSFNT